jgi:hypothetical protein
MCETGWWREERALLSISEQVGTWRQMSKKKKKRHLS